MSNFFEQNELNTATEIKKETSIDVSGFSRIDLNTPIGELSGFKKEDIQPQNINIADLQPFTQKDDFKNFEFKKQVDKTNELFKFRVKLFASIYLIISLILTGFVIYNVVATTLLTNKQKANNVKIKEMNKVIDKFREEQPASINPNFTIQLPNDLNF